MLLSWYSTRLMPLVSAHARSASVRASTSMWRAFAIAGIITFLATLRTYGRFSRACRSPVTTIERECEMRVESRSSIGVSNRSLSS